MKKLTSITLTLIRICLTVCILHGLILLVSCLLGYLFPSPIRFAWNVEALKSFLVALSVSAGAVGVVQRWSSV